MRLGARGRGALAAVLLALAWACVAPRLAFADDPPKPVPPVTAPTVTPAPADDDVESLFSGGNMWAVALLRLLPAALGIAFLVLAMVRREDVKAGLRPPPPPTPPPTVPFGVATVLVLIAAFYVLPSLILGLIHLAQGVHSGSDGEAETPTTAIPIGIRLFATACATIPLACIVLARRRRLQRAGAPPGIAPRRAVVDGLKTYCVAMTASLAVGLLAGVALQAFTPLRPKVQDLVKVVKHSADPWDAWLILAFGVLMAPLTEECIFRGMLFPAFRKSAGKWAAVAVTSLVFAAIHIAKPEDLYSFFPLLALAVVLALQFERTNSILAVTTVHALNNLTTLVPLIVRS